MVACDVSQRVGVLKKAQFRWLLHNINKVRCAQDVPPPTDPWKWGGAIGAWILSPAQEDTLNPKFPPGLLRPFPPITRVVRH